LGRLASNRLALRATLALLLVPALLGGGWLWLRGSSLVAVEHVRISGVNGPQAIEIAGALGGAAKRMTTLDFNPAALRAAVASYPVVGALRVRTSFPHGVSISVSERQPVAALVVSGQRTAVAADGTVLGPALASSLLPSVSGSVEPAPGARLREPAALAAVIVLGAAPAPLARFVARVYEGSEGLTVAMRGGLLVYFGNDTRPHAKWLSLARVLVSPGSAGALYIDVRLPERPAAGFSSTTAANAPASAASGSASAPAGSADPTTAALAASLEHAVGVGPATASGATSTESESASTANGGASAGNEAASSSSTPGATSSSAAGSSEAATATSGSTPSGASESG
jgi:cell division protein FtsQ